MTIPNQITAVRLILSIVVFALIGQQWFFTAMIVFLIAAATDWVDGYWARKFSQVSKLGRVFDPFVDKIIICGTFIYLSAEPNSEIQPWMTVVVVGRELLVTALRGMIEQSGGDFSATMSGKVKMGFQCAAVVGTLWLLAKQADGAGEKEIWLKWITVGLVWLAVLSTIQSGVVYVRAAINYWRAPATESES